MDQIVAGRVQARLTAASPTWCAIAEARGEKIVRSVPRSFSSRSWLRLDGLADLVVGDRRVGRRRLVPASKAAICARARRVRRGRGRVVAVAVDDHVRLPAWSVRLRPGGSASRDRASRPVDRQCPVGLCEVAESISWSRAAAAIRLHAELGPVGGGLHLGGPAYGMAAAALDETLHGPGSPRGTARRRCSPVASPHSPQRRPASQRLDHGGGQALVEHAAQQLAPVAAPAGARRHGHLGAERAQQRGVPLRGRPRRSASVSAAPAGHRGHQRDVGDRDSCAVATRPPLAFIPGRAVFRSAQTVPGRSGPARGPAPPPAAAELGAEHQLGVAHRLGLIAPRRLTRRQRAPRRVVAAHLRTGGHQVARVL